MEQVLFDPVDSEPVVGRFASKVFKNIVVSFCHICIVNAFGHYKDTRGILWTGRGCGIMCLDIDA